MAEAMPTNPEDLAPAAPEKGDPLAAHKAKFNELLAKQKAEVDLSKPFPDETRTTPSEKREKPPKPAFKAKASEPEAEEAPEEEAPKRTPESEKLRAKLLLAGNPKRAIESLSDEEVGEWWKKQEEREQATALALQRASELEKQVSKQTTGKSEPLAGVPTDELDPAEIVASLKDQFGEEEAGVLAKVLADMIKPLQAENREIKSVLERARQNSLNEIVEKNRARLGEKLSLLKTNDQAWKMLSAVVRETLAQDPQKYSSAEAVFDDVFQGLYGELAEKLSSPPTDDAKVEKARIAAAAHTPPASVKRQRAATPLDAHRAAFEHLTKNPDDTEGARKAYGRFLVQ